MATNFVQTCKTSANRINLNRTAMRVALIGLFISLGIGNAWAGHDQHTATLNVAKGTGNGTVYASTSGSATSGSASASFDCGKSADGQHTGTLYAYATPASGYTFLGWTTSASSSAGADNANPKGVAFDVTDGSSTQTLYAHFVEKAKVNITFEAPSNGTYTIAVNGGSAETVSSANVVKSNVTGVTLTATPASGYAFAGWYKLNSAGEFVEDLSIASPYNASFTTSETIKMGARFVPTTLGKFILKGSETQYYGLKAATIAAGGSGTIVPVADETLVDGSDLMPFDNGTYTIKAGATLLVPYSSANEVQTKPKDIAYNTTGLTTALSMYKKLITREGVSINIMSGGVLCVGGQLVSYNGGNPSAYPIGACGVLDMSNGGHIELNGTIYCWGFIKGQDMDQGNNTTEVGTITANNGSVIWEDFAVGDWRGGTACSTIAGNASSWKFFPFQSYTIQNVEVPTTYHYGATLSNYTNVYGGGGKNEGTFSLIGKSNTLFQLKDASSSVCKWYDPTTDLVNYEMRGTAQLDALNVDAGITTVSSSSYNLPLSSNMQIVLAAGCNMTLSKPMVVQPGAVVEVKSGASLTLSSNTYIFDVDNWGMYCNGRYFYSMSILTSHKNRGTGTSKDLLDDAKLIVDGTLNVTGKIYATDGGANIMGNGAGSISFSSVGSNGNIVMCTGVSTNENVAIAQANLCNEDESYTKSIASTTFHNVNGRWFAASAKDEKANHTYDFTYISSGAVSGAGGTNTTTDAVYSNDKTGMEARMKWFNVTADACADWWHGQGTQAGWFYNWTMNSAWHQFQSTETEGLYSGSNNKIYTKTDCNWEELGETDVNCLYTIDGKKKALVDGHFIELEPNSDDAAFHEAADPTKYYICFEGCNWHAATKYEGEKKAYVVDGTTFIWFEERWMAVEREEPFFYTKDETNVTIYYEYIGSEWVLAQPYVEVTDAIETRQLLRFNEAITVASGKKNATITLLRDLVNITTPMTFTAQNTTCTLDLNGHVAELQVKGSGTTAIYMLTLNCAGTTFTITDNTADKKGELKLITSFTTENNTKRWGGIYLQNGALVMANGKLHVENPVPYTKSTKVGYIEAILVASGKTLTVNGGTIEAKSAYNPYGIEAASGTPTININGGTIETIATTNDSPYGISGYGTINIKGGEVRAIASGSSSSRGVSVSAGSSYQGTVNVTGGTIYSEATGSAQGIYCGGTAVVTGDYNATTPNNTPKNRYYARTITAVCRTSTSSYGVLSYGTTTISGGTITSTVQKSNQNTAYGVCASGGTTTIQNGANITANAPTKAYGVTATGANGDSNRGWPHIGVVNITGGTITANTTNTTTAYGLLVTGATWTINKTNDYKVFNGDYAAAGTATVTGGTFNANAKTTLARGIAVGATKTLNDASATPKCTINGGYYKMTGTGDVLGCNASALPADFHINGGYYSHDGNLATYAASPKHVLTLAAGDANRPPYYYKVAEAYQVTFKTEDGTANIIDPIYQEVNTKPVCSTEPTKASTSTNSFTFDGWATAANGDKVYEKNGLPNVTSAGATYYAHFATTTLKYRVHFDAATNGGDCATENIYVDPGTAVGSLPTATKYGYTFSGWFTAASGGTKLEATTVINANADYYAQFTVNSHTLTWDLAGGAVGTAGKIGSTTWPAKNATGTQSRSVAYGTVLTTIPVVTKAGYVFNRWDPVPTSSMPDNDVTYTALWNPATNTKYYVKHYQQNIDDDNYTLVETDELTGTTDATVTPDRKSYDGFLTPTPQQLTIGAAGTTELAYYYDRVVYTIYWNASANGGACATASTEVRHGANIALPAATKAGHILEGWYTKAEGGNKISEGATILQNYGTLYAQFVPTYTIIWNDENGNELSREEKLIGESLTPPDYSKEDTQEWDYTFHGWNDGTTTYAANAIPAVSGVATYTADVTKVKNNYTLTIGVVEAGYGSVNETSVTVPYGTSVSTSGNVLTIGTTTVTATPTASNAQYTYTFSTWQNVPTSVTGNVDNIQAVFTRTLNTVTVTWKNGGDIIETDEGVVIGATPSFDGETPTKATDENFGYTFDGWSTTDGGEKVDPLPAVSGNTIYYAHYSTTPTVASVTVGGSTTYYADFATAWAFVNDQTANTTIKLLQDVTSDASLVFTPAAAMTCTLDLNNHTLSGAVSKLIDINLAGSTFVITDNSVAKGGKVSNNYSENARVYGVVLTAGTLKLQSGTISSTNPHTYSTASANKNSAASAVYVAGGQTFTMENGTVESASQYASYAIYMAAGASTVTIENGLVKGRTTASTTAAGICNLGKGLTINGGHIIGHAYTTTAYGVYLNGGHATINGGTIEATNDTTSNKGTTTTYGIYVAYKSSTYKGVLTIPSTSSVNVFAKARTTTAAAVTVGGSSTGSTIAGGTFTAKTKTSSTAYGVYSSGNITISGGTFNVIPCTSTGYGIYSLRGKVTISGSPTFNVTTATTTAYGAFAYGTIGKKGTGKYSGTIEINGGTFNVTSTKETAYGAYAGLMKRDLTKYSATNDTVPGMHYMPGVLVVNDGTFNVKAKTTAAYGIVVAAAKSESGAVGTTARTPTATITGGKFKVESAGDDNATAYAMNSSATATNLKVQGGWYNTEKTNASSKPTIGGKYTAPTKDCNYHVLPLTGEDPYKYEVAEAYTITFVDGDGNTLTNPATTNNLWKKGATPIYSGATPAKTEDENYTYTFNNSWSPALAPVAGEQTYTAQFSSTPRTYAVTLHTNGGTINAGDVTEYTYGTGATLPTNVTKDGHEFGGWFDNSGLTGDAVTSISNTATGNKEYWAKWTASIADRELDIVDWTSNSITINVTNLKAVNGTNKNNWKIYVNDKDYTRTSQECSTQSRTLTISGLSLTPNENLLIQLKNDADVIESQHNYKIPQIYNAENATLSGTTSSSVVYVYGGKLTISGDITLAALYVCPGAEVEVTGTLNVGKLVLRTKPWATAAISGSVTATNVYYTRIAPDGSASYPTGKYYQFGLPYECDINDVRLSDGTTPAYNTTWILKSYNEEKRATNGATGENWDVLASSGTIAAGRGYEIFSSYKYYREYYFPVTPTENTSVAVTRHGEDKNNSGWNIVCSPLMSVYENKSNPVDGLKVSWLLADGYYDQAWPEVIWPALPFSYQASATGYLDFSTNNLNQTVSAPRRAAYKENIQTEWIHLDVKDENGVGDHTSVFVHPDRFEATYQTGIDVAKQSFTASRALIYSSHAYGEMAFAGVADVLLENGVALTVYSPKEQELTISMRDNEWLDRMAYVWLIDNETGAQIDLLDSDYTFEAATGTTDGRFILMGRFFAPQIATGIDEVDGEQAKARKIIIQDKMYILLNGQLYDATGKQVNKK